LVDKDRKTVSSIFTDTTENRVERDLENYLKDDNVLKKYKPESFKIF
jgi:hypothetical protein